MSVRCLAAAAVLTLGGVRGADAQRPLFADPAAEADRLVQQLAAPDYQTRALAAATLKEIGPAALPAIEAAKRSADPEVRASALRLAVLLRRAQFGERIDAFLRDDEATLPGWREFAQLTATGGPSRRVYAGVYRADHLLIDAAFPTHGKPPAHELAPLLEERLDLLASCGRHGTSSSAAKQAVRVAMAAVLLAAARPDAVSDRSSQLLLQTARTELTPAASGSDATARAARGVIAAWITSTRADGLYVLSQMLRLADELELREAAPLALAIARGERTDQPAHPQFRATALLILGRLGDASHAAALAPLLDDRAVCATQAGRSRSGPPLLDVQLRDVAIAVTAHLSGKTPAEFGLEHATPSNDRLFVLHTLAFADDAARQRALEQLKPGSPAGPPLSPGIRVAAGPTGGTTR
ncbi:MAG: hypothetical protein AAGJ46_15675 [Planctomycetota bacterium]